MKIRLLLIRVGLLIAIIFMFGINFAETTHSEGIEQMTRTVNYSTRAVDEDALFAAFDNHTFEKTDDEVNIVAQKSYSKSLFEELDLVNLDKSTDELVINYGINYAQDESMVYLSVSYDSLEGEEPLIEVLSGIVTLNDNGDQDVMFKDGDDILWLSDIENYDVIDNAGFWSFVRKVINKVTNTPVIREIVNTIAKGVAPIIRFVVTSFYITGVGPIAAWIGAKALNMNQEYEKNNLGFYVPTGIYHANFNCWQKNVGYDDFYDEVFDNGTNISNRKRMERHKYEIDMNSDGVSDYILWAWKGDYYNLGAGCELGIYERVIDEDYGLVWRCATSKAFNCNLKLELKNIKTPIINWNNDGNKHWWFTGFNSNYQFPILYDIEQLTVTFDVTFNCFNNQSENNAMFNNLYSSYSKYVNDTNEDWKYWSMSKSNYEYFNGMKCYKATLSF